MAVKYKVVSKRPGGMAGTNEPKYYPVLTGRRIANTRMISDLISSQTTLNSADVMAVIESFIQVIPQLLQDGYNVRLDELGTFSLHASAVGQDTPEKVTARDITTFKISFLPDKRIKEKMQGTEVYKG